MSVPFFSTVAKERDRTPAMDVGDARASTYRLVRPIQYGPDCMLLTLTSTPLVKSHASNPAFPDGGWRVGSGGGLT